MKDQGDFFGGEGFLARGHATGFKGGGEFYVAFDPGFEIGQGTFLGFALRPSLVSHSGKYFRANSDFLYCLISAISIVVLGDKYISYGV